MDYLPLKYFLIIVTSEIDFRDTCGYTGISSRQIEQPNMLMCAY